MNNQTAHFNPVREALIVFFLAILTTVPWLGRTEFHTRGEAREALVAQALVQSGDWILPHAYDGAVPSKPPFLHWLIGITSAFSGEVNEFSSRFPSAVVSAIFLALWCLFLRQRVSKGEACVSALILMTNVEWARAAVSCRVDLIHAASFAGGCYAFFGWWEVRSKVILAFASVFLLTIGVLSKGPVAIVLPGIIFGVFLVLEREPHLQIVKYLGAFLIPTSLLSSIWYVLAYRQGGEAFLEKFTYENVQRFTSHMADAPHKHGVGYLVGVLIAGLLPWTLYLLFPMIKELKTLPLFLREPGRTRKMYQWYMALPSIIRFSLLLFVLTFLFYAIPSSKRSVYLLCAYPALSLLAGHTIWSVVQSSAVRKFHRLVGAIIGGLFFSVGLSLYAGSSLSSYFVGWKYSVALSALSTCWYQEPVLFQFFLFLPALAALFVWIRSGSNSSRSLLTLFAVWVVLPLAINSVIQPLISRQGSLKSFSEDLKPLLSSDQKVYSYGQEFYAISFYTNHPVWRLESAQSYGENDEEDSTLVPTDSDKDLLKKPFWVLVGKRDLNGLKSFLGKDWEISNASVETVNTLNSREHIMAIQVLPHT